MEIWVSNIRHIAPNIFSSHSWFGSILAAFDCGLTKLLAEFLQFSGSVCPVGIVVSHKENLLSLFEDKLSDLHDIFFFLVPLFGVLVMRMGGTRLKWWAQ